MKDTYYFPHDYHARHDTKIEAMVNDYGVEGYGMYWVLIERLYESRNNKIEKFPKLFFGLATELCVSPDRAEKFVLSLINDYRLLKEDERYIWSDSVLRRMEIREQQRLMKVESGRIGGIHSGITRKMKQNEATLQKNEANEAKERKRKEKKRNNNTPSKNEGAVNKSVNKKESVFNDKEKAILESVKAKTNIYALIEEFKHIHKVYPPKDLLLRVCQQFLDKGADIQEPYPYLKAALHRAAQDEESLNWKKEGMAQPLKEILGMR